eukprot:gene3387-3611_t
MFVLTTLAILTLFFSGVEAEKIAVRILGTGAAGATKTDGIAATTAQIKNIMGLWLDTDGVLYAVDSLNSVVRKVVSGNHFVAGGTFNASVATTGGDSDKIPLNRPHGITVKLQYPNAVYVDSNDQVYIIDKKTRIRTVVGGIISAFAGENGFKELQLRLMMLLTLKGTVRETSTIQI